MTPDLPRSLVARTSEDHFSRDAWKIDCDGCGAFVTEAERERCGCGRWRGGA